MREDTDDFAHIIRVDTVDGEVVDPGGGGVGADVGDADPVAGGGAELVAGVEVLGVIPARGFAPQAMHGGLKEAAVVVDPERVLRSRDDRGHRIPGLTVDIDRDLHQVLVAVADDRGHNLLRLPLTGVGIGGHHPIPQLDLLDRLGRTVGQQHQSAGGETITTSWLSCRTLAKTQG